MKRVFFLGLLVIAMSTLAYLQLMFPCPEGENTENGRDGGQDPKGDSTPASQKAHSDGNVSLTV